MKHHLSRRNVMLAFPATVAAPLLAPRLGFGEAQQPAYSNSDTYPAQDPAMVREMVGAAHAKPDRVRELLRESPRLAIACWDWGFGDWETPLGAASHVGNPEIAKMLLAAGARADLFTHAMLGNLDVVRATVAAMPGIERVRGPHGLTLAHHARQGEAAGVIEYLKTLPGADVPYTNLPLTPEQQQPYVGVYRFGEGPTQRFEVLVQKSSGSLGIQRSGGSLLRLMNQGEHVFHPPGSDQTLITFTIESGKATKFQITGPGGPVLGIRAN